MDNALPLACATSSLNPFPADTQAPYDLPSKLRAISKAGFRGIELAFPDLLSFAEQLLGKQIDHKAWNDLCKAAREVHSMCKELKLEIMMLQPFNNLEGWPKGSPERQDAFERAEGWIRIMQAAETDMLQASRTRPLF